jgi:hypothetical protein
MSSPSTTRALSPITAIRSAASPSTAPLLAAPATELGSFDYTGLSAMSTRREAAMGENPMTNKPQCMLY